MNILLTGGNGMVGKNIHSHPGAVKYNIFSPRRSELNLFDSSKIEKFIDENEINFIIHSAGRVGGIQENIKYPFEFLFENLRMGMNLAEICAKRDHIKVINLGSSCMYPRDFTRPLREEDLLTGTLEPTNEGYALAKIVTAKSFQYLQQNETSQRFKTLIPCNLFGQGDKFDSARSHLIAAVIQKIDNAIVNKEDVVEIWGDGESRREFMDAFDLADAIFFCIENFENIPEYINIGLGVDFSINEYYKMVAEVLGYEGSFKHDLTRPTGMKRKLLDTTKINSLGWYGNSNLKENIERAFEYFKETGE